MLCNGAAASDRDDSVSSSEAPSETQRAGHLSPSPEQQKYDEEHALNVQRPHES
jgi:hypothetical protein